MDVWELRAGAVCENFSFAHRAVHLHQASIMLQLFDYGDRDLFQNVVLRPADCQNRPNFLTYASFLHDNYSSFKARLVTQRCCKLIIKDTAASMDLYGVQWR